MSDFQSRLQTALGHEFLIERELGGGGMSRVFLAVEKALQRRVVVKVLPPELAAGVNVERFRREIQLAAGLQHPHIVPLLAAGDDNGLLWFSMPFIEGESLRAALTKQPRLAPRDVVRILHDVVDALSYAHARGIVHRDIKPDNVLASGMHALVTDFGVAKALSAAVPLPGGTTTGMAIGTPAYMAPEQLAADPAADHRVDLYAVGLLAYELLTGKSPFSGSSPQATLAAQLTLTPAPPHLSFADVPEELSGIIMHCLEKDAARRPASAAELLAKLDALPPMASGVNASVLKRRTNRRGPALAIAGLALVTLAVVASPFARRTGDDRSSGAGRADTMSSRDAGPGGDRRGMNIAPPGARDGGNAAARVAPETVIVVYRDTGGGDGIPGVQVPVIISRAESLAIAEAMQKRFAAAPSAGAAPRPASLAASPASPAPSLGAAGGTRDGGQEAAANAAAANAAAALNAMPGGGASVGAGGGANARTTFGNPASQSGRAEGRIIMTRPDGTFEVAINRDEMLSEVRRVFTDSMQVAVRQMNSALANMPRFVRMEPLPPEAMERGVYPLVSPNSDGRMRLVIAPFSDATGRTEMKGMGRELASYLRASLPSDRFEVMDDKTTEKALKVAPERMRMGWALRSDYVVSGFIRERNDSLAVMTVLTDVRGGRHSRAEETVVAMTDSRRAFEIALGRVTGWLEAARKRGPGAGHAAPGVPNAPGKPPEQRGSERGHP